MTTPNGQPSVQPSPRSLGDSMQQTDEIGVQANAKGGGQYSGRPGSRRRRLSAP